MVIMRYNTALRCAWTSNTARTQHGRGGGQPHCECAATKSRLGAAITVPVANTVPAAMEGSGVHDGTATAAAVELLTAYYAAMNRQDVPGTLAFLTPDVHVSFPEAARNWSGLTAAADKFAGMYTKFPGFHGSFVVRSVVSRGDGSDSSDGGVDVTTPPSLDSTPASNDSSENTGAHAAAPSLHRVEVRALCSFRCSVTGEAWERSMVYGLVGDKIESIVHEAA